MGSEKLTVKGYENTFQDKGLDVWLCAFLKSLKTEDLNRDFPKEDISVTVIT